MVSRADDFGVLNPWLWGPTQPWADLLPPEQALPQLFAPEDQATIGAAPDDDIQAWLQQQQDPSQFFEALATAALVSLLIDYLANDMHRQDTSPRQAGQLPGASFANGPQPTSWGSGGAPAPTSSQSAAPSTPVASNLPPGEGLENLDVHVIGDSLMVGARGQTEAALGGAGAADVTIDAAGGRAINGSGEGHHVSPAEIRQMAEQSGADVLVLELGSNHNDYARFVPETMDQLATLNPPPTVVWVNTQTQRPNGSNYGQSYYDGNAAINEVIAQEAARRPNMFVADWSQIAGASTDGGDGLHLSGAGNDAMAGLIRDTIAAARS